MQFKNRDRVLFIGDSITDAGRNRDIPHANDRPALGAGYALFTAARLLADHPGQQLKLFNRGISGNKVTDLADRWQADCLDLKPDVLSLLIGVNDIWHGKTGGVGVPLPKFERVYRNLLNQAATTLEPLRLILCEPFVLRVGAVDDSWFPEFDHRRAVVRQLAEEFDAVFVPFQRCFDDAIEAAPPAYWAHDGVHPTVAGHMRMSRCWLDTVQG